MNIFSQISYVSQDTYFIKVYQDNSIIYSKFIQDVGTLIGFCENYIVTYKNGYYEFYDINGKKFLSKYIYSIGEITYIRSTGFVSIYNDYLYIFNIKGILIKKIYVQKQ